MKSGMREVVIIGTGLHRFGRYSEKSCAELGKVAIVNALKDAGVSWKDIQACYAGSALQGMGAGHNVCRLLGETGIPIYNLEQACGSGSAGIQLGYQAVARGEYDLICAAGFEKQGKGTIPAETYPMWARDTGLGNYIGWHAMEAQRYIEEYGLTVEMLAKVSVNAYHHAAHCPAAAYNNMGNVTIQDILNSKMMGYPLTLYMIGAANDAGAAVIMCTKAVARKLSSKMPITVAGSEFSTTIYNSKESRFQEGGWKENEACGKRLYEATGIGPEDINVVASGNQFAITEIKYTEALGFCKEGEGGRFIWEGNTALGGKVPFNTDGSHIARGNALGANGIAGVVELVHQLRGECGARQVRGAKVALAQSSGAGQNIFLTMLKK
jgi:acetyl-CoA acetyltransferase